MVNALNNYLHHMYMTISFLGASQSSLPESHSQEGACGIPYIKLKKDFIII